MRHRTRQRAVVFCPFGKVENDRPGGITAEFGDFQRPNVFHVNQCLLAWSDPQAVAFLGAKFGGCVLTERQQSSPGVAVDAIHPCETDEVKPWRDLLCAIKSCADDGVISCCGRRPLRTIRQDAALLQRPDA
ncbi:hypothetical protein CS378_22915 [Rhodococcus ruber]|nr:hypothetical protein CS378_22915 [Rhodococcus ruber]